MNSITIPSFTFEDGTTIPNAEIAFQTWGRLNEAGDNVVIVCHTLTGNTDVSDWWGRLLGPGKALDTDRFFVLCASVIGSPYGGVSPLTIDPETGDPYGPDFPPVTVRDTVGLHRHLLDELGVTGIVFAIGGSLGAMQALEWAALDDRIHAIVPIAAGAQHSAWGIGWSEAQRQCIFADPKWNGGRYDLDDPPAVGLANARMVAMLSYRCGPAYDARFGRDISSTNGKEMFDMVSYLQYQGEKLVSRFDANCYVSLTRQMNSHDVGRDRGGAAEALRSLLQPALVIGITSDILYPIGEQEELVGHLHNGRLAIIDAPHGHDSFLIEVDELNRVVQSWVEEEVKPEVQCQAA